MNKKKETVTQKQLKMINERMEKLVDKMNRDYNNCVQELLQLSTLLQNLQIGETNTNAKLMR
jgi:intergrase/recombinase